MQKTIDKEQFFINTLTSKYIGDDAAVVGEMLYSMDAFFEDVHFKREWMSLEQIARKAMIVNISDAIAMNAKPLYALVALSIPKTMQEDEIKRLSQTLQKSALEFGCEIIGGDTIGGDKLHLTITIISQSDTPLLRSGLQDGDLLAYTGAIGESKAGLLSLMKGESIAPDARFFEPILRIEFIQKARKLLHAGMDISDGLFGDTNKLLDFNNLGMEILKDIPYEIGSSGEEYEMLIAFDETDFDAIQIIANETNTPITVFAKATRKNVDRFPKINHHFD